MRDFPVIRVDQSNWRFRLIADLDRLRREGSVFALLVGFRHAHNGWVKGGILEGKIHELIMTRQTPSKKTVNSQFKSKLLHHSNGRLLCYFVLKL